MQNSTFRVVCWLGFQRAGGHRGTQPQFLRAEGPFARPGQGNALVDRWRLRLPFGPRGQRSANSWPVGPIVRLSYPIPQGVPAAG